METFRLIALIVILILCVLDLSLTYYYVRKYKDWQPNKPYKLIEVNPILVFLWNNIGLILGTIVGGILIMTLNYIVVTKSHWAFSIILFALLIFALYNHYNNITLLNKLIEQYPLGHLPTEVFGNVTGNN